MRRKVLMGLAVLAAAAMPLAAVSCLTVMW